MSKNILAILLIMGAITQLIIAVQIARLGREKDQKKDFVTSKKKYLDKISRVIQVSALSIVLIYLFLKGKYE